MKKTVTERLGKPFNDCIKKADEFDSALVKEIKQMGSEYRQYFCYRLCQLHYFELQCKCKLPYQFGFGGNNTCRLDCLQPLIDDFNFQNECDRHCPLECDSTEYSLKEKTSLIQLESLRRDSFDIYDKLANYSNEFIKENLIIFNFYYERLSYTKIFEMPKVSFAILVSKLGGTIGNG